MAKHSRESGGPIEFPQAKRIQFGRSTTEKKAMMS